MSDKVIFKTESITGVKEGYFVLMNGSINQKDRKILNVHVPNYRTSKCINP